MLAHALSFYLLSLTQRALPAGIAYAIWSGSRQRAESGAGRLVFGQRQDLPALTGLGLMVAGVLVANLFFKGIDH